MEPATSVVGKEQTFQGAPTPKQEPRVVPQKDPAVTIGPPAPREASTSPIRKVSLSRSPKKSGRR